MRFAHRTGEQSEPTPYKAQKDKQAKGHTTRQKAQRAEREQRTTSSHDNDHAGVKIQRRVQARSS